jgi:hypothetical protein
MVYLVAEIANDRTGELEGETVQVTNSSNSDSLPGPTPADVADPKATVTLDRLDNTQYRSSPTSDTRFRWTSPPQPEPESREAKVIASAWNDQMLWSDVANSISDKIYRWRIYLAVLTVAGIWLATSQAVKLYAGSIAEPYLAALGLVIVAAVPYLREQMLPVDSMQNYLVARSVAEQLKSTIYRYLMGVLQPVASSDQDSPESGIGPNSLIDNCQAVKAKAAELSLMAALSQAEPHPRATRLTIESYVATRVVGQMKYYRLAGRSQARQAMLLKAQERIIGLILVVIVALTTGTTNGGTEQASTPPGAASTSGGPIVADAPAAATSAQMSLAEYDGLYPSLTVLIAVLTATSGYLVTAQNNKVAERYFQTYDRLKAKLDAWEVSNARDTPEGIARFVDAVELIIANEVAGHLAELRPNNPVIS